MRHEDRTRLLHMIEAAETIAEFVTDRTREELDSDRILLFALVHAVEVFGEAAAKVSPGLRAETPQVPWARIVAMRNRLIHASSLSTAPFSGEPSAKKFRSFYPY